MSDIHSSLVRLVPPPELPVRIPDWPESVGIAVCRVNGRTISLQPYHLSEQGQSLKRRLVQEAGEKLRGFAIHPPVKGMTAAKLGPAEDLQILSELEQSLRSMPRLLEEASDFAINFDFAVEEGLTLDGLSDQARKRPDEMGARPTDHLPVGYHPYAPSQAASEVIAGAVLRPQGAAGVDLLLVPEKSLNPRDIPPEADVLVREDSLRVAIALGPVLEGGRLPKAIRLPAGALMLSQSGGKPVPALVLRRGGFLFVAPDYSALAQPAVVAAAPVAQSRLPWKAIGIGIAAVLLIAAVAVGTWLVLPQGGEEAAPLAPVQGLRENLFAPRSN